MEYFALIDELVRSAMLIGENGIETLKKSKVIVFGVGGVGSFCVEALVRSGVGCIGIVDSDEVSLSNINRQLIALHSTVGRKKVEVMKERISDISPDTIVNTYDFFFDSNTLNKIDFKSYDYIVDCIDSISCKVLLAKIAQTFDIPIISALSTGNKMDPTKFQVTDIFDTSICPIAKIMRKELKKEKVEKLKVLYSTEAPIKPDFSLLNAEKKAIGSISFVPSSAGLIIAGEVICDLIDYRR